MKDRNFCEGPDQDFYVRNRLFGLNQDSKNPIFGYFIDPNTIQIKENKITTTLFCSNLKTKDEGLNLIMEFYKSGTARFSIEKISEKRFRAAPYVLTENMLESANIKVVPDKDRKFLTISHIAEIEEKSFETYKSKGVCEYRINLNPFYVEGHFNGNLVFTLNHRQLLNYEIQKDYKKLLENAHDVSELPLHDFKQISIGCKNPCPKGPQSVAIDCTFHEFEDCYGLPERYRKFKLNDTKAKSTNPEPYRLYNLDLFEDKYKNQNLYGNIALVIANNPIKEYNGAIFWLNSSDTYIDYENVVPNSNLHFISECGILDCFTFLGNTAFDICSSFGKLTGTTPLPQFFTLGYHQCRWDKDTQKDIEFFNEKFEEINTPCDCLWLDIEHTDEKRYFTWDHSVFPEPLEMIKKIEDKGRHLVVIVDPHVKLDPEYKLYQLATKKSIFPYFINIRPFNFG